MADLQPNTKDVFFSKKNEDMLQRLLFTDVQRRTGSSLNDTQRTRLQKTVDHYMGAVYSDRDNAGKPVQALNKEVLQAVIPDYLSYLRRSSSRPTEEADMDRIRNDVSSRFETMQIDRQGDRGVPPTPPNFQLTLDDNSPSSLSRFELIKQERELEAKRMEDAQIIQAALSQPAVKMPEDMIRRIQSDDMFRTGSQEANQKDREQLALRDSSRLALRDAGKNEIMDIAPDPRRSFFGEGPRAMTIPNANPTIVLPDMTRSRGPLPQDVVIAQDDVIKYKENEYNLFIYSADRDWVTSSTENRYNFSVVFDPANNRSGFGLSPSTYIKFKNISRIELVKIIMPTEACDVLTVKETSATAYETNYNVNVFSYPYLQVRIDELNTNGFGTNDGLNNAFGVVSYDAYWASDSSLNNRGFTRLIPKFLKCQKVFYPTPLATLQKMTIQIQKPDGTQFCTSADAIDISGIVTSAMIPAASGAWPTGTNNIVTGTNYWDVSGEFLWIQTKAWFSKFAITQGDRVNFKNTVLPTGFSSYGASTTDFLEFINRAEGHIVSDIAQGYLNGSNFVFKADSNKVGYSNFIIIRNKFNDPATGTFVVTTWGGNSTTSTSFLAALKAAPGLTSSRMINMSHQIQLIFRVITRDMDSATRVRPDNLY
jgi:hypothetical protein